MKYMKLIKRANQRVGASKNSRPHQKTMRRCKNQNGGGAQIYRLRPRVLLDPHLLLDSQLAQGARSTYY